MKGAGKTTIMTAIWQLVTSRAEGQAFYLKPEDHPPNTDEWNALKARWLQGEEIDRTKPQEVPNELDMVLSRSDDDGQVRISVPDVAGEAYQLVYEQDSLEKSVYDRLAEADHVILVVNIRDFAPPVFLPHQEKDLTKAENIALQEWDPKQTNHDAKNVALMVRLREMFEGKRQPKFTIVLAAWDLEDVRNGEKKPTKALGHCFPLSYQFATNNFPDLQVVGVSAQGWDYDNPPEEPERDPAKRVLYVTDDSTSHDLTQAFA